MNCTIKTGDFCKTLHLVLPYPSGKAKQARYAMTMTFGRMGEPLTKVQKVESTKTAQSYDFTYKYEDSNHPTAPTQIGHEHYTYDANGNPTLVENDSLDTERRMYWDEDNRLMVLSDNGKTSRYTYNAAGERIAKSHGDLEGVYVNGAPQGMTFHETEDYTIYPAPIITVTKNRFTKHYFIGDKRIASKLGTGKFSNVYGISSNNVTAGQKDYAARMLQIEKQREEYYRKLGTPPGVPTMKGATADPDNTGYGYNTIIGELGDHSVPEGWVQRPKFNKKGDVPGPPIQWQKPEDPDNAQPGYGYVPADTTNVEDIFFYHSDHLGSTSYITDAKANITQFDAYLPYGELLVDEHSSTEEMPYKFNGKELDSETGLYYYGARYMNPVTSLWYGVDPLAERYVATGGYVYTLDNPVRLIDPDGRKLEGATKNDAAKMLEDINVVFKAEKFADFRRLISRSGKHATGKDFNKIDPVAYSNYIANNSELSNDDKALMDILVNSINSDDFTYKFQYVSENDELPDKNMLAPQLVEAIESTGHTVLTKLLGGSQTKQTKKGSYSLVVEDDRSPRDYYNNLGEQVPNPLGRVLYVFHEVFGHGRSLSLGRGSDNQHGDAIRLENLVLRVAGFSNIQRNGEDHGPKTKIPNNSQLPDYR